LIGPTLLNELPQALRDWFQPETELLAIPLVLGGSAIGIVVADNRFTKTRFTDRDVETSMDFILAASPSIQNTLLFASTSQAAKWADITNTSVHVVAQSDTPEEAADHLLRSIGCFGVALVLCSQDGRVTERYAAGNARMNAALRPGGISVEVMSTGRPWWTNDAQKQSRMNPETLLPEDRAMVCLPMHDHGQIIGVAWLSFANPREFEGAEIEHFQKCVSSAAAVCRAASNRKAANQLITTTLTAAGRADLRDVTSAMVKYAKVSFGAGSAMFWPWDGDSGRFLPQLLVSDGISDDALESFRGDEPQPDHITVRTLESGYYSVADIETEPLGIDFAEQLTRARIRSFQSVALHSGEDRLGVLYINYPYKRSFGRDDRSALDGFAAYASWLISNARLSRRADTAKKLAQKTAHEFALGSDCASTLRSICEHAVEMFECTNAVLFRYDQSTNILISPPTTAGSLRNEEYLQQCVELAPDHWLMHFLKSEVLVIEEEVDQSALYRNKRFAREEGIKTFMAVALRALGRNVGLLFINYQRAHRVTEQEKHDLQLLADFAATALYQTQHYADLAEFGTKLLQCSTVRDVLQTAVRQTARVMGTPFCDIVLRRCDGHLYVADLYGWGQLFSTVTIEESDLSQSAYTLQENRPIWVDDYATEARFPVSRLVYPKKVKSGLSALLKRGDDPCGVILVHTTSRREFRDLDGYLLESLGNQISEALERARHFDEAEAKRANVEALNASSRALIRSIRELNTQTVYEAILDQAIRAVNGKAILAILLIYDQERKLLSPAAVYPNERKVEMDHPVLRSSYSVADELWATHSVGQRDDGPMGGHPNCSSHEFTNGGLAANSKAVLSIPLLNEENAPVGLLHVESDFGGSFDDRDRAVLQSLALVMVIVLQVGRKHEELLKARGEARARLILAWLGMAANHGWHSSRGQLATIQGAALNIRQELIGSFGSLVPAQILENLELVEALCKDMLSLDLTPPLESREALGSVSVNDFLQEFCYEVENRRDRFFHVERDLKLTDDVRVTVNAAWLRCALNILVDNAVRELRHVVRERQRITLATNSTAACVEVIVQDRGRGIPVDLRPLLGKEAVPGAIGVGVGYLIAQAVAETYGGGLTFETGDWGTRMIVRLPISNEAVTCMQS
jgi:GAF domain-containing protein